MLLLSGVTVVSIDRIGVNCRVQKLLNGFIREEHSIILRGGLLSAAENQQAFVHPVQKSLVLRTLLFHFLMQLPDVTNIDTDEGFNRQLTYSEENHFKHPEYFSLLLVNQCVR